jgi:hypothetical protein
MILKPRKIIIHKYQQEQAEIKIATISSKIQGV